MKVLVTGCGGLIGSEAVEHYSGQGHQIFGIDNNMRQIFFGPQGDITWNLKRLETAVPNFLWLDLDIRNRAKLNELFEQQQFDLIIHCAAQPSHDKAKEIPFIDFEVNALGTINLLEMTRLYCPEAVFIHMSTNKVYGESPNEIPLIELETRWDYANSEHYNGIPETCQIDQTTHSLFGASKTAADIMAQEYGRYFGIKVGIFRGGCLTGPSHSGVELHGFLSYLVKASIEEIPYTIFGYKGKQVRDNIHSYDVIRACEAFANNPRPGEVYNLGGGRQNSISMLEAIDLIQQATGKKILYNYDERNRIGDHICYISDLSKLRSHFPEWEITISIKEMIEEMVRTRLQRFGKALGEK
jgi:CDP-paratose 2-epimerase